MTSKAQRNTYNGRQYGLKKLYVNKKNYEYILHVLSGFIYKLESKNSRWSANVA